MQIVLRQIPTFRKQFLNVVYGKRTLASSVLNSDWQVVQRSVCQRDGRWFLKLLQAETDRMEGWCRQMELDQRENALPEDSRF